MDSRVIGTRRFALEDIPRIPVEMEREVYDALTLTSFEGRRTAQALAEAFGWHGVASSLSLSLEPTSLHRSDAHPLDRLLVIVAHAKQYPDCRWYVHYADLCHTSGNGHTFSALAFAEGLVHLYRQFCALSDAQRSVL